MKTAASSHRWYVVQARSNCEKSAAQAMRDRIVRMGLADQFGQILVPSEDVVEMRASQKKTIERKFFPGYILVQIVPTEDGNNISSEAWHMVKETPKVLGFIGGGASRPAPITDVEAERILARVECTAGKPRHKVLYEKGQMVRVKEGPFNDFNGVVDSIDYDKARVRVAVQVFGRATPVDFGFTQVEAA